MQEMYKFYGMKKIEYIIEYISCNFEFRIMT